MHAAFNPIIGAQQVRSWRDPARGAKRPQGGHSCSPRHPAPRLPFQRLEDVVEKALISPNQRSHLVLLQQVSLGAPAQAAFQSHGIHVYFKILQGFALTPTFGNKDVTLEFVLNRQQVIKNQNSESVTVAEV